MAHRSFTALATPTLRVVVALVIALMTAGTTRAAQSPAPVTQHPAAISGWPSGASVLQATCPGVRTCFVVGTLPSSTKLPASPPPPPAGVLAYTHDAGAGWTVRTYPRMTFGAIACANPAVCYVVTSHVHLHSTGAHTVIATATSALSVTADGGKAWQQRPLPAGDGPNSQIACPGTTRCVLWAETVSVASAKATVLITRDGGRTWRTSRTRVTGQPSSARLACPTFQTCYMYGGFTATAISKSQDGGLTWRTLPGSDMFALSHVPSHTLAYMGGNSCPSARVCYTAQGDAHCQCDTWGPYGTIFGTTDGGNHWRLLYRAEGMNYPTGSISCPSTGVCYAAGATEEDTPATWTILETRNGGRAWATHKLPVGQVSCPSTQVCYAGARFRTTDGGATWQALP